MGIAPEGDGVVPRLQHVTARALGVIGGHVLSFEGDGQGLGLAGLQQAGLIVCRQVGAGLLNAAVGVGGPAVDLHHVLARNRAGIGDSDVKGDGTILFRNGAHLLLEGGVAQAVAEGVLHHVVIVEQALLGGGLIELVAHIDALHVVDEKGSPAGSRSLLILHKKLVHVFILEEVAGVPHAGGVGQVVQEGVHRPAGGIHRAGEDIAQGIETGLAGAGAPQHAPDLGIVLHKAQLHGVGPVIHQRHVVEVFRHQLDHVPLALGEAEEVAVLVVLLVLAAVVLIVGPLPGPGEVDGQVGALAAHPGDDDQGLVGEAFGSVQQLIGVSIGGGLGQGPVLFPHPHLGPVSPVVGVEPAQFGVGGNAGVGQAVQQADDGVGAAQRAGAGAAVAGVGAGPAEHVQLGPAAQRKHPVVGQQGDALVGDVLAQLLGIPGGALRDGAPPGGQGDEGIHRPKADQVYHQDERQGHGDAGLGADDKLLLFGQLHAGGHGDDPRHDHHRQRR